VPTTLRRAAPALGALLALGGCGGGRTPPPADLGPAPTGIEVVNESRRHLLIRWHSKSAGGGGSAVVPACADHRVDLPSGSYRIIFTPTSRGEENVDFEVGEQVECCVLLSRAGVFSVAHSRPPPSRC
jgi:hypothetical protein